jgi:hypothetical protein
MQKKLCQNELEAMKSSIPINDLPKNFQDAIRITRGIGVHFLWIDSLCIIQDSLDDVDWKREASRMGLVYAHAICVISATASASSEDGCFYKRQKPPPSPMCVMRTQAGYFGAKSLVVRPRVDAPSPEEEESLAELFDRYVEKAPLTARGWTFQERILAKRIVHYCNGFVLFECNTLRASEYHAYGVHYPAKPYLRTDGTLRTPAEYAELMHVDDRVIVGTEEVPDNRTSRPGYPISHGTRERHVFVENPDYKPPEQKRLDFLRTAALLGMRGEFQLLLTAQLHTPQGKAAFHCAWYDIVEIYSIRALTRESDRLIALTGIASFIAASTGGKFLAGTWKSTLLLNLLWNVKSNPPEPRPLSCSAPTWSWASTSGGVETKLKPLFAKGGDGEDPPVRTNLVGSLTFSDISQHDGCVLNAKLGLKQIFDVADSSKMKCILDIPDFNVDQGDEGVVFLPILFLSFKEPSFNTFRNRHIRELGSTMRQQIHGIILRRKGGLTVIKYERMGYFWAEESGTGRVEQSRILHPLAEKRRMILV